VESKLQAKERLGHEVEREGTYILKLVDLAAAIWALGNTSLLRDCARDTDS
jgi:hypothetical protein